MITPLPSESATQPGAESPPPIECDRWKRALHAGWARIWCPGVCRVSFSDVSLRTVRQLANDGPANAGRSTVPSRRSGRRRTIGMIVTWGLESNTLRGVVGTMLCARHSGVVRRSGNGIRKLAIQPTICLQRTSVQRALTICTLSTRRYADGRRTSKRLWAMTGQ